MSDEHAGEDTLVEPRNPYVEIAFKEVGTGREAAAPIRLVNGDTMTVWVHGENFAGADVVEGDR